MGISSGAANQEHWSGRAAFILAAVGSAVGLGNLVRFPYVAGDTGGGAFVVLYLLCILFIGIPVLMAELYIGRRGGGSSVAAIRRLATAEGKSSTWALIGWIGMVASFLIVTFYSVLAGWVLHFVLVSIGDLAANVGENGPGALAAPAFANMEEGEISAQLGGLVSNPTRMLVMHAIFMAVTVFIVSRGVKGGIEAAAKVLMPIFFFLLIMLTLSSLVNGDAAAGFSFLFKPDFSALAANLIDGSILLQAIGQAFFSLSLGSAMMVTYGIYMSREEDIPTSAKVVGMADTSVALVAGLAIFPIVFSFPALAANLDEKGAGFALLFDTLPLAFHQLPFGGLFAIAFFIMTLFAALTSSIALLEVAVAFTDGDIDVAPDQRRRRRLIGAISLGGLAFLIGVGHALSQVPVSVQDTFFNSWQPLGAIPLFAGKTLLDVVDILTANVLLPLGGFLTAIFAGWIVSTSAAKEELRFGNEAAFGRWLFLVRWVAPAFVGAVLIYGAIISPVLAQRAERGSEAAQVIEEMSQPAE